MSKRISVVAASVRAVLVIAAAISAVQVIGCKHDDAVAPGAGPSTQPVAKSIISRPVVQPAYGFQERSGDEIVICGKFYRIGTRVVTWMDPGGYDAYRTEDRFTRYDAADYEATVQPELSKAAAATQKATTRYAAATQAAAARGESWPTTLPKGVPTTRNIITGPERYGLRYGDSFELYKLAATRPALLDASNWDCPTTRPLTKEQIEEVRGGGWPLELLQQKVDQFVIHYDVDGTSMHCFSTLQDDRHLSVQFMLDLDGTIYQTLDCKERAWQATKANGRSIGIEIANVGAYGGGDGTPPFATWYKKDASGHTFITIPPRYGGYEHQFSHPSMLRPSSDEPVTGVISKLQEDGSFKPFRCRQYDLTPQQYAALPKLIAGLCDAFPLLKCDYPRNPDGTLMNRTMTAKEFNVYEGVLGHYHVQTEKTDPGPAFQWEKVIGEAKKLLADRHAMASK